MGAGASPPRHSSVCSAVLRCPGVGVAPISVGSGETVCSSSGEARLGEREGALSTGRGTVS